MSKINNNNYNLNNKNDNDDDDGYRIPINDFFGVNINNVFNNE